MLCSYVFHREMWLYWINKRRTGLGPTINNIFKTWSQSLLKYSIWKWDFLSISSIAVGFITTKHSIFSPMHGQLWFWPRKDLMPIILDHLWWNYLTEGNVSGCRTVKERTPHNKEVLGLNPLWCSAFFSSISTHVPRGGATLLIFLI